MRYGISATILETELRVCMEICNNEEISAAVKMHAGQAEMKTENQQIIVIILQFSYFSRLLR